MARMIFAQAGVEYEYQSVTRSEWPQLKPNTPTGLLPVLEVDGKKLTGSEAIARFLAERFGLAGSNDIENAQIAGIVNVMEDFTQKLMPWFYEKDEEKKPQHLKVIQDVHVPRYWSIIEKMIQNNNSDAGWIYGEKPTYADFAVYGLLEYVPVLYPNLLDTYPGVAKLKKAVEALPNIAKYLKQAKS